MSALTRERRPESGGTAYPRQPGRFEVQAWFFMRISGLFLIVLALTHWTLMHFLNRLSVENAAWIQARYRNVFWPLFDAVMLLFAMVHGTNGIRYIIDDYIKHPTVNALAKGLLYSLAFIFIVFGLIVIAMIPSAKLAH